MDTWATNLITSVGVPTTILLIFLWKYAPMFVDALDRNTKVINRNTIVMASLLAKIDKTLLDCDEELKQLYADNGDNGKSGVNNLRKVG